MDDVGGEKEGSMVLLPSSLLLLWVLMVMMVMVMVSRLGWMDCEEELLLQSFHDESFCSLEMISRESMFEAFLLLFLLPRHHHHPS